MTMTVTAAEGGSTANDILLSVIVLTGQAASPIGAIANSTTAVAKALTPTASNSWIYGAVADNQVVLTANGSSTLKGSLLDSGSVWGGAGFRSTAHTTAGTPITTGISQSPASPGWAGVEILAGTGLAEDASAPAVASTKTATTITTAAFTPPAGSLLVALIACNVGFSGVTTLAVSGGSLTWTQVEAGGGGGSNYLAAVWVAQVATPPSFTGASRILAGGSLTAVGFRSASGASRISAAGGLTAAVPVPPSSRVVGGAALNAGPGVKHASGASSIRAGGGLAAANFLAPASQTPGWQPARAGMPGDPAAVNLAAQVGQYLGTHDITPVYPGTQIITSITARSAAVEVISLGTSDVEQPFVMPAGKTAIGRVTLPLAPAGAGADVTVSLWTDSAGSPGTLLTSTRVPASWLTEVCAPDGLAAGGPLATAAQNTMAFGAGTTTPWTQPAVSLNGSGNFSAPVTSGNYTVLIGGFDSTAGLAIGTVATVAYLGGGVISAPIPQPALPSPAFSGAAGATADTLIYAGGAGLPVALPAQPYLQTVWTASWDPSTGEVGSWTGQAALPTVVVSGAIATWQEKVYVIGGNTDNTSATSLASVWWSSAVNGQITAWTAGPSLPRALSSPFVAAVNGWLIVAGGVNASGTPQTATWYAAIGPDGTPGPWQDGPPLPVAVFAFSAGWNLVVTDSAMVIVSGETSGGGDTVRDQILCVTADGPAPEWQLQTTFMFGAFQVAWYPGDTPGTWQVVNLHLSSYDTVALAPMPLISVPLPASGLTAGATYHVVVHQDGGGLNDYTEVILLQSAQAIAAQTRPPGGGSWSPLSSTYSMAAGVFDQTPGGSVLHTWEDSGARTTSLVVGGAVPQLLGLCEATEFEDGTLLTAVTAVVYDQASGVPVGAVQLA